MAVVVDVRRDRRGYRLHPRTTVEAMADRSEGGSRTMDILPSTCEVTRRLKCVGELCAQYLEMVESLRPREVSDLREIEALVRRIAREIDGACRVIEEMELPPSGRAPASAFLGSLRDLELSYGVLESALRAVDRSGIESALAAIGIAAGRVGLEGDCWVMYMVHLLEHAERENP